MGSKQRGAIIAKNDYGTLERVDGSSSYIGTDTLPDGKVLKKTFRSSSKNDEEVKKRWLKWQGDHQKPIFEDEEDSQMEKSEPKARPPIVGRSGTECPFKFSGGGSDILCSEERCALFVTASTSCSLKLGGSGLYYMASNMMRLDVSESLELVAMAIGELNSKPPVEGTDGIKSIEGGLNGYFEGKTFLNFVNLHGKKIHAEYKKFCVGNGYPLLGESEFVKEVAKRYPDLKPVTKAGGTSFAAA